MNKGLFADVLKPGEQLLWTSRPTLRPFSLNSGLALAGVTALGLFGAVEVALAILDRLDFGVSPIRITKASPGFDLFVCFVLIAVATINLSATWSDRKLTIERTYAISDHRVFQAIDSKHARTALVATPYPKGTLEITRKERSVDIEIAIYGPYNNDNQSNFTFYGLSAQDAENALPLVKRIQEASNV